MGYAKSRSASRRRLAYFRTRLRRFGLSNPAIRLLGLSPFTPQKKSKSGIGTELRFETGRFPCFQGCFRIFRTIFKLSAIFPHFISASTIPRPPAPARISNMLRMRAGAGGRDIYNRTVVVSFTKSEFLSYLKNSSAQHMKAGPGRIELRTMLCCFSSHLATSFRE